MWYNAPGMPSHWARQAKPSSASGRTCTKIPLACMHGWM